MAGYDASDDIFSSKDLWRGPAFLPEPAFELSLFKPLDHGKLQRTIVEQH